MTRNRTPRRHRDRTYARPGANSALRAATPSNPRRNSCPTCGRPNMLTDADVRKHYQCDQCGDREEGAY